MEKPVGQSNLDAFFDAERVRESLAKTPEMVAARRPIGGYGQVLTDICQWCFNPFDYTVGRNGQHRSSLEYEELCAALLMPSTTQPVICEPCYQTVLGTAKNAQFGFQEPGWMNGLEGGRKNTLLTRGV